MARSKQHKKSRLVHWVKVVLMFLSFGFIFPHAMTEDEDTDNAKSDCAAYKTTRQAGENPARSIPILDL
jgi:hypothetical protein